MNDIARSISDIEASPKLLREHMVRLSSHGYRRSRARGWVTGMRVLTIHKSSGMDMNSSEAESDLSEVQTRLSPFSTYIPSFHNTILRLVRRSALKEPSAYVAVSYCWNREHSEGSANTRERPLEVVCEDLTRRPTNTPPDVLYRSMAYAEAQSINALWIDQECIDQNDPMDKENGIQEMDLVYHESDYPIAVLEFSFQSQNELDVFASICDQALYTFDPSQIDVLESVLVALTRDKWFERAWTLQESVSAGAGMTLLLGCPGLQKPPDFGPTPGEFEICIFDFQNALVNVRVFIEEGLAADVWSDPSCAINASNCADVIWNHIPFIVPDFAPGARKLDASQRQVCNAAQALTFLGNRFNSFFPDRLAILANLCDYDYRLNTEVLELPNSSFTICCLTLAIINGDMSLLGGYRDQKETLQNKDGRSAWFIGVAEDRRSNGLVYQNDDYDLQSNAYGFSWGPKPLACLKNITFLDENGAVFRIKPATLSAHGLRVCGVLWDINCKVNVPKTQRGFASRWQEELAYQNHEGLFDGLERQKPLVQDFLWCLHQELIESGVCELSRTVWDFVQPRGRVKGSGTEEYESARAPCPYPHDTIFGNLMQVYAANQHPLHDEQQAKSRIYSHNLSFDPDSEAVDRPSPQRLLIDQVCKDGALICGAPMDGSSNKEPCVWFEACKMGEQIFTPAIDVDDRAAHTHYDQQAMSWRVLVTGQSVDDCKILHCLGRRRGIMRVERLNRQDYILE